MKKINYTKLDSDFYRHHIRFAEVVLKQSPRIICPECNGEGGEIEPVLDYGEGPFYSCGWCEGTGYITPWQAKQG